MSQAHTSILALGAHDDRTALAPIEAAARRLSELWRDGQRPDWQRFLAELGPLSSAQKLAILRVDHAERWRRGDRMIAEDYFQIDPELAKCADACLLVYQEILLRRDAGETVSSAEIDRRFPEFAEPIRDLLPAGPDTEVFVVAKKGAVRASGENPPGIAPGPKSAADATTPPAPGSSPEDDWLKASDSGAWNAEWPAPPGDAADLQALQEPLPTLAYSGTVGKPSTGAAPPIPTQVGKYEIIRELGRGGMGVVYQARDTQLKREVALKMVLAASFADASLLKRFHAEAEAVARLHHPNIVQIHEIGIDADRPYVAFELLDGGTLHDVTLSKPQPPATAATLVAALARAMYHAHLQGIIHRDLKPTNVLLEAAPNSRDPRQTPATSPLTTHPLYLATHVVPIGTHQLKISDFGLAKNVDPAAGSAVRGLTRSGDVIGTPNYMAPEQIEPRFGAVGPAADIYSLGAILYELLAGRPPFEGSTPLDTLLHVTNLEPVPPTRLQPKVPRDLETICLKCLQKEPARRYSTALELAEDLQRFLDNRPILARPLSAAARLVRWCMRNPMVASLAGAMLLVLVLATIGSLAAAVKIEVARVHEEEHRRRAEQQADANRQAAVRLQVNHGVRDLEMHDLGRALPWFAGALQMDQGDPAREDRHRRRLAAAFRRYPKLVQVWLHNGATPQTVLSPDGRLAVTISADTTARLWDTTTGETVGSVLAHTLPLNVATFSPTGRYLATAGSDAMQKRGLAWIWDVTTCRLLAGPIEHHNSITGLSFSSDEQLLATASWDETARAWDVLSGQPRTAPLSHPAELWDVMFRPGTHQLFTTSDSTVRGWDADSGQPLPVAFEHPDRAECISFSADGRRLAIASVDGSARVWNPDTGEPLSPQLKPGANAKVALITPDGERLVTSSGDGVKVWNVQTGAALAPPIKPQAAAFYIGWDHEARQIVTGSGEIAQVWNATTGEPLCPPLKHNGTVNSVAFLPDGHRILTSCGNTAQIWDLAAGETPVQLLPHRGRVARAELSPDGRYAVTLGKDRSFRLWNTATGEPVALEGGQQGDVAAFSPDSERIVLGVGDSARVWLVSSGQPLTPAMQHGAGISHVAFSPDGSKVASAGADRTARIWDAATGAAIGRPLMHRGKLLQVVFSPDSRLSATGSEDHTARIWDAITGAAVTPQLQHDGFVGTVRFSSDGRFLVTASADRTARIWNVATGIAATEALKHLGFVRDATFSPDSRFVATCSYDQTARIWRVSNGQPLTPPLKHNGLVDKVLFSRDGEYLLTISRDRTVQVWETATGDPLTPPLFHDGPVHAAAFDRTGSSVITISGDALLRRWMIDLHPDRRPVDELTRQANLLDGHYIDATGGFMPLEPTTLHADWVRLRSRYPADFTVSEDEARAWRERIAAERFLRQPPHGSSSSPDG